MSTNFIFKTSYLAVLVLNLTFFLHKFGHNIEQILYFTFDEKKQDLEENVFGFVDILHRRYKLGRDVEQTPTYCDTTYYGLGQAYIWRVTIQYIGRGYYIANFYLIFLYKKNHIFSPK